MEQTPPPGPPPQAIAMEIATGHWKAQATRAFITSNIAGVMEKLCSDDNNFVHFQDIANEAKLNANATFRLLRYLSTFGICVERSSEDSSSISESFKLGPVGAVLTPNHPQSVAKKVLHETSYASSAMWQNLDEFLKTDEKVCETALGEPDYWDYLAKNPTDNDIFEQAMTDYTKEESSFLSNKDLSPTFDLSSYDTVCDLGGAEGALALTLAKKRFPDCKYIISDLPHCVARIDASSLPSNFSTEAADFLKTVPIADAYLLKHIIHDWDDEHAGIILNNIKKANPNAAVFVIEFGPMPGPNVPHLAKGFGEFLMTNCNDEDLHLALFLHDV